MRKTTLRIKDTTERKCNQLPEPVNSLAEFGCRLCFINSIFCQPILTQRERSLIELKGLLAIAGEKWGELPPNSPLRLQIEDTLKYTKLNLYLTVHHEILEEGEKVEWESLTQYSG
jgi:hypothetical protein